MMPPSPRRYVTHVGPAIDDVGGISTVIRLDIARSAGAEQALASYRRDAAMWGLLAFCGAAWRLGTRPRRSLGVIHVHLSQRGSYVREGALVLLAALRRLPLVATIHGSAGPKFIEQHRRLTHFVLKRTSAVAVLGDKARLAIGEVLPSLSLVVVPNSVDIPEHHSKAAHGPPRVLFAGEVGPRKGVDVLLSAWPAVIDRVPAATLDVAGPVRMSVVSVRGVSMLGPLSNDEVLSRLENSWVACLPSRDEGLPMFLLEAMARARPVVAAWVGEIPDLLEGLSARLDAGDVAGLTEKLVELLSSRDVCEAAGLRHRRRVEERYSYTARDSALRELYERASS